MIELNTMNEAELHALKKQIDVTLVQRKEQKKQDLRSEMHRLASDAGMSLVEVLGIEDKKVRAATKVKYRNPANADQTSTGRGRKPQWVLGLADQGKTLEDCLI